MTQIEEYQRYIIDILEEYKAYTSAEGVEMQVMIDKENHHYQLSSVGWRKDRRVHGCILHIDIKGNKLWIQHDGTEEGLANIFLEKGVPKENIVLAFHSPYKRQYTGFAVA